MVLVLLLVLVGVGLGACSSADTPSAAPPGATGAAGTATAGSQPESAGSVSPSRTPPISGETGTAPDPAARATSSSTTEVVAPTTAATPSTPSTPAASVAIDPANAAFCGRVDQARGELAQLDPANEAVALATYKKTLAELTALAPAAIDADLTTVNDAVQSAKDFAELQALTTEALITAKDHIDKWTAAQCGFSLGE